MSIFRNVVSCMFVLSVCGSASAQSSANGLDAVMESLSVTAPYTPLSIDVFERYGWPLPDDGKTVKALADAAPGGAFDPRELEKIDSALLGYTASWHEVRFSRYGLEWDITALKLTPHAPSPDMPTVAILNGGAANWYEFFVDPKNQPGLGQYLAQKLPVVLLTIPGNYKHNGWTDDDFGARKPEYLIDVELTEEQTRIRNASFTFRVVAQGVEAALAETVSGPLLLVGHSTGGELQFMLKETLSAQFNGRLLGWGTGGPAALDVMQQFRGKRKIDDYPHVSKLRARTPEQYSKGYLGPLNPYWNETQSRQAIAEKWMAAEERRRPQFKQPLQDFEHSSTDYLKSEIAAQIRETLEGSDVDAEMVIADLFSTMDVDISGYQRMVWVTAAGDTGHWDPDLARARELLVAEAFRDANPDAEIRVLLLDFPMTHYGHIERPRGLAGVLFASVGWLVR